MSERNKAQVRRVIEEVYNRGDLGVVDQVAASDLIIHASSHDIRGREGAKQYVAACGWVSRTFTSPLRTRSPKANGGNPLDRPRYPYGRVPGHPAHR